MPLNPQQRVQGTIAADMLALGAAGIVWMAGAGVPTDGTSGTGAGFAGKGSIYSDTTNGKLYVQGNTTASPTWKLVTSAS